jgi:large subunit ribosomal protein L12
VTAHSEAFNLAYQVKYPCSDTVELFILEAHQQAVALAISQAIYEPDVIEQILAMANMQAHQLGGEEVEYVYAAMLLHKSGQKVDEKGVTKVLEASGAKPDSARVKALVAALSGVNIEEAIKKAPAMAAAPAPTGAAQAPAAGAKKEEKKSAEDEKKTEEEAASGLAALFG